MTHFFKNKSASALILLLCIIGGLTSCNTSKKISSSTANRTEITQSQSSQHRPKKMNNWQKRVYEEAITWLGTPYKYACSEKGVATDCSGFVLKVYEDTEGWKLPRNSAKQAEYCLEIGEDDVKFGDLVFFATGKDPERVSHVGIMLEDGTFLHASSKKGVCITSIHTPYYQQHFIKYGRLPQVDKNS